MSAVMVNGFYLCHKITTTNIYYLWNESAYRLYHGSNHILENNAIHFVAYI